MISHRTLLTTADEILALADSLRQRDTIAFDTEFIRETTFFPIVEIIQVATEEESWLVDAHAFKKNFRPGPHGGFDPAIQPLLDVFRDKSILKVLHAAQGDQECLFTSFGVVATPTIDTAVAASLCGYGEGIGLGKLLKAKLGVTIAKGHARTNWSVRPLPAQLIDYAHADVEHLVSLGRQLLDELNGLGRREWALEASAKWEEAKLYEGDPAEMAQKMARGGRLDKTGFAALRGLVRWREQRVRQLNLPRRWVADDTVLLDLAHVRPKDLEHLAAFRGLNKGELKNSGEAILAALREQPEEGERAPGKTSRLEMPSADEVQSLELLRCFIGILADEHRIASKHLLSTGQLLPLLRSKAGTPDELVRQGLLGQEAAQLIGEELIAFMQGKRALSLQGGRIRIAKLEQQIG
ncbi:MAG: HRDC domain-containing protein [Oligoflexia bacterium]|nr:HRDC domain-containing protein [Oligoflexia bacterium]